MAFSQTEFGEVATKQRRSPSNCRNAWEMLRSFDSRKGGANHENDRDKDHPEDYILSALTPEERLAAAFRVAEAAFNGTNLTMKDVENTVKTLRKKACATKK